MVTLSLGPREAVLERPFTAIELIDRDLTILRGMLDDLVGVLTEADQGLREIEEHKRIAWQQVGLTRRMLVCNEVKLRGHGRPYVVGFFGERRDNAELGPLEAANSAIVAQFRNYPGILSYSSVELPNGYWANMVLHDDPIDKDYWSRGKLHAQAARTLAPEHYRTVRIHNARLTAGVMDDPEFVVMSTKYWDYSEQPEWAAERVLVTD